MKFKLFLFSLYFSLNVYAQPFEKISTNQYYNCVKTIPDSLNNIYYGGETNDGYILLTKLDESGNHKWNVKIGNSWRFQYMSDMMLLNQNKIVLIGTTAACCNYHQLLLAQIDSSGQVDYVKTFGDSTSGQHYEAMNIFKSSPIRFGVISVLSDSSMNGTSFLFFDNSGNLIYSKKFDGFIASDAMRLSNNSFMLIYKFGFQIAHFNSLFTTGYLDVYSESITGSPGATVHKFVKSNSGDIYFISQPFPGTLIGHFNSNYDVDSAYYIRCSQFPDLEIIDMKQKASGNWIALGINGGNFQQIHYFLAELTHDFIPIKAVMTTDTFDYDLNYHTDLNLNSNEDACFSLTQANAGLGVNTHFICTDSSMIAGCNGYSISLTRTFGHLDSLSRFQLSAMPDMPLIDSGHVAFSQINLPLTNCLSNGIPNQDEQLNVTIFPNPVNDFIRINKDGEFFIYDYTGNVVMHGHATDRSNIDLRILNSGIYFFHMKNEKHEEVIKFIKIYSEKP